DFVPRMQARLRAVGLMPPHEPAPEAPPPSAPAVVARPNPDGTIAVDIGSGFVIAPGKHGAWIVEPIREEREEPFDANRVIGDAIGRSFAYAQNNALELARIGRDIATKVGRAIFLFGITLMLAAYMMLTREKILGFFSSLLRESQRPAFASLLARVDR